MKYVALMLFTVSGVLGSVVAHANTVDILELERLQKKCMVELRHQFVPKNCYQWVKKAPLRTERKKYLMEWFNAVCKKALHKDESQVQYHVHSLSIFSQECQTRMETAFAHWSYKSKSENPERLVELMIVKNGKELEYTDLHDKKKARWNRNTGSARRGLN